MDTRSHPHQLTGIYPTGTTCSTTGSATALYSASYDAWGNETSRTYNNVTASLSYDALNRLVEYHAGSTAQEFYLYDASGNRVLKRSITGTGTDLTAYAYGLQELNYVGTGGSPSQTDYYSLGGHLIGSTNGTTTTYDLTDAQGSVLMSLDSSGVQGEQAYGPYGNQRYTQGTIATDKGYTGQFHDAVSGLDYYNARYYDPAMGQFLSADNVQGNAQGVDPYSYAAENPETMTDPTGNCAMPSVVGIHPSCVGGGGGGNPPPTCSRGYILKGGTCVPDGNWPGGGGPGGGCHVSGGTYGASNCTGTTTTTKPSKPKPPTPQQVSNAQLDAGHASAIFGIISGGLSLLALSAGKLAAFLEQLAADLWVTVAGLMGSLVGTIAGIALAVVATVVTALAATMLTLAATSAAAAALAVIVAGEFYFKGSDHNASDWTPSAMANFQRTVDGTIASIGMALTTIATIYSYTKGLFNGSLKGVLPKAAEELGMHGIVPALLYGGGIATLGGVADSWIGVMNSDLGYS